MTASIIVSAATLLVVAPGFAAADEVFAVFRSGDRGHSWMRSDAGMPRRSRINAFGSAEGVLFAGTDSGIFTSKDGALSWQPATGTATTSSRVVAFATLGRRVLAGTDGGGVLVSPDGGASWADARALPSRKVRCLLVHSGKVVAGTDAEGVFVSNDAGQTWTPLAAGLPAPAQVFALSAVEGRLFAGLYSRGLYAWDEQSHAWAKTGLVTPLVLASVQDSLIAGHNPGGLSWSEDLGASWSKGVAEARAVGPPLPLLSGDSVELSPDAPVWALGSDDRQVFAGASTGIHTSDDRGRTWTRARTGLPQKSPGLAFLLERDFVLAATLIQENTGEPDGAATPSPPIRPRDGSR